MDQKIKSQIHGAITFEHGFIIGRKHLPELKHITKALLYKLLVVRPAQSKPLKPTTMLI